MKNAFYLILILKSFGQSLYKKRKSESNCERV